MNHLGNWKKKHKTNASAGGTGWRFSSDHPSQLSPRSDRDLSWRKIITTTTGAEAAAAGGWGSPIVNIQRDSRQKTEDRKVTHLSPFEGENWGKRGGQWPCARGNARYYGRISHMETVPIWGRRPADPGPANNVIEHAWVRRKILIGLLSILARSLWAFFVAVYIPEENVLYPFLILDPKKTLPYIDAYGWFRGRARIFLPREKYEHENRQAK